MNSTTRTAAMVLLVGGLAVSAQAQQFQLAGRTVQVHGFFQQGYGYSDKNNFLTMKTSDGSFAMTDGGINISSQLTDKFRVGAQAYTRNIGDLTNGKIQLDWAFGDYRLKDWFGIRAGKVKTPLGLYNDTQDMEFLHTWALLPQAVYPLDQRASTIAHVGGDIYGEIPLRQFGSISYAAYAGARVDDPRGGIVYSLKDFGFPTTSPVSGRLVGFDTRWNTPVDGFMAGFSWMDSPYAIEGRYLAMKADYNLELEPNRTTAYYAEYTKGKLRLNGEFRRSVATLALVGIPAPAQTMDTQGWFTSAAYRVAAWLEFGTYHSRFYSDVNKPTGTPNGHIFDQAVTARVDINKHWNVKAEGHFMDGHGDPYLAHGFYLGSNPQGLQSKTNLLVLRTGVSW